MRVYKVDAEGRPSYVHGPADLVGYSGDLAIRGEASEEEAVRWSVEIGLAVARGSSVRRLR